MPISYQIDEARRLVLTTASGALTDSDILRLKARLVADPKWKPGMRELSDVRLIDRLEVTADGVRQMMMRDECHAAALASYRLAIVVSHQVVYGMARMYQMLTEQIVPDVRVFRDMEEAKRWLAVDEAAPPDGRGVLLVGADALETDLAQQVREPRRISECPADERPRVQRFSTSRA
jgi:hypothetical protein